jgi:hypothetical protein
MIERLRNLIPNEEEGLAINSFLYKGVSKNLKGKEVR